MLPNVSASSCMSDDGVKLNQTDPLFEQFAGSLGSEVAWLVSSVVLNGRLVMTVAPVKLSLGAVAAWAAAETRSRLPTTQPRA